MRVLLVALLVLVATPAVARADTFTAAAGSPRDASLPVGRDIANVAASFDDAAGSLAVDLTLQGVPEIAGSAAINVILYGTSPSGGCGDVIAYLRSSTDPTTSQVTGTVLPTTAPRAAQSLSKTGDGAVITLTMTDTAFVGVQPGCMTLNLTHFGVQDAVESVPFAGPKQPPIATPTPTPTPTPQPTPTPAPLAVRFAHPGAKLKASSTGTVAIALSPFARGASGTVTIRRGGRTVGHKSYTANAGAAVTVRVKLDAASRRSLARGSTLSLRIAASARAGADTASRTTTAKVQSTRTRTRGE